MRKLTRQSILIVFSLALLVGCKVTGEKIELWKSTQNGPQKIAEALVDDSLEMSIRSHAAVALIEIKQHALLKESFEKMGPEQADSVAAETVPTLAKIVNGTDAKAPLSTAQVAAKDGLFLIYEFAGEKSKKPIEDALIAWCTQGEYNTRARAGFNVRVIVQKIGAPAYRALATILTVDQVAIKPISKLIRDSEDKVAIQKASTAIAKMLEENVGKFSETHLTAAAILGGEAVGDVLVKFATNPQLNEELQRYCLRAYSVAIDEKSIIGTEKQLSGLIAMAQNEQFDKYQREETYMTLAQIDLPQTVAPLKALLKEKEFFWRLVGVRCLLRLDGQKHLASVLKTKKLAKGPNEVEELISLVSKFPALAKKHHEIVKSKHAFSRGVAIYVLAKLGNNQQSIQVLQKLTSVKQKLPKGFKAKTVGAAASDAIEAIGKKG